MERDRTWFDDWWESSRYVEYIPNLVLAVIMACLLYLLLKPMWVEYCNNLWRTIAQVQHGIINHKKQY